MTDQVRVWCLRHGESANVTGRVAGRVPMAALTEHGVEQAVDAGRALAGEPIRVAYASTALRTRQTAARLAADLEVVAMPELAEVDIGAREGSTDPVVHTRTAQVLRAWVVDGDLTRRVADGETGHDVVARIRAALHRIAITHPGATVAVVGHVASLTAGLSVLCGLGARVWGTPLPPARPFLVRGDGRTWHCPAWPTERRERT